MKISAIENGLIARMTVAFDKPVTHEERTFALEFHRGGSDGTCRAFYRTVPEIKPGAPWTHGIHLVYYDYLSEKGLGWFKGLQTLADRIRGYLKALLAEYGQQVDGFVWDETFYIPTNFISYPNDQPAYADCAMMSLVSEMTQIVQACHKHNPDLVFLASDLGRTSYALVANGTWQDSAMREQHWGPSMFSNYRNSLWSCNWYPRRHAKENAIAAEKL